MRSINQYSPYIPDNDAVGNNIRALRKMFIDLGFESTIFRGAEQEKSCFIGIERYIETNDEDSCLVIHYCLDDPKLDFIKSLPGKKILIYHNITPPKFFEKDWPDLAKACKEGREKLKYFKDWVDCAVGISDYNLADLEQFGISKVFRIPLLIDFEQYKFPSNQHILKKLKGGDFTSWLFVGRVQVHKKHDDLIRIFHYYQKYINPKSRLNLVGMEGQGRWHSSFLKHLIEHLGVKGVTFTGSISQEDLLAYYKGSDLFVCMSEHEGLCVPLIEAMVFGLPIIAFDAAAVGETVGSGGILIEEKKFAEVAELAHYLLKNQKLKNDLINNQKERLKAFSVDEIFKGWKEVLKFAEAL
ncbi:MAG: hypothetical protein CL402_06045 [Acidiferrobacteraceae bacterium]|nr:hypothetical protein [Acidiferrobacteraceae bacterium]